MSEQNVKFVIFGIGILCVGISLIYLSVSTQNNLKSTCNNNNIFTYLNIIMLLGVFLSILPITTFFCNKSNVCICSDNQGFSETSSYMIIISILCIFIIILAGLTNTELTNSKTLCDTDSARTNITWMIVIPCSVLIPILVFYFYQKILKSKDDKESK